MGIFYLNSFWLPVNGNGGFVGNILTQTFLENLIIANQEISYYILILITTLLFLKSINFSPMGLISFIKKIKTRNVSNKITENQFENSEVINSKQLKMDEQVQENFSFDQKIKINKDIKIKYRLLKLSF